MWVSAVSLAGWGWSRCGSAPCPLWVGLEDVGQHGVPWVGLEDVGQRHVPLGGAGRCGIALCPCWVGLEGMGQHHGAGKFGFSIGALFALCDTTFQMFSG